MLFLKKNSHCIQNVYKNQTKTMTQQPGCVLNLGPTVLSCPGAHSFDKHCRDVAAQRDHEVKLVRPVRCAAV